MTLGGHVFIRDAIRFDYCVVESVKSLLPVCDEVVVMDCSSTDGTDDLLRSAFGQNPKVKIHFGGPWDLLPGKNGERLRILADMGRELLTTDWQFMLQADEVLHERSYDAIIQAMHSGRSDRYYVRRVDLYGGIDRCIFLDISGYPEDRRPMNPDLVRLAKRSVPVVSDAGTLDETGGNRDWFESITIYHYSMVRDPIILNRKILDMQTWYHGQPREDDIILRWVNDNAPFDHRPWKTDSELQQIPFQHPEVAAPWVSAHRK